MALGQSITVNNPSEFTYPTATVDIATATYSRLADQRPSDILLHDAFNYPSDASYGEGTLTRTLTTATVEDEKLNCKGGGIKYATYNVDNIATLGQTGCIEFDHKPDYTGIPAAAYFFFYITAADNRSTILCYHDTDGTIKVSIYDSSLVAIVNNVNFGAYSPTVGVTKRISLNFDITVGSTKVFIAGTELGSTGGTGTRDAGQITIFRIGTNRNGTSSNDAEFDNFSVYSTVQHTTNYTPTDAAETIYSTANSNLINDSATRMDKLTSFSSSFTASGSDTVKFQPYFNSTNYGYTNSAWTTTSQTYTAALTDTEINTYSSDLDSLLSGGVNMRFRSYLHSDAGTTTPQLISYSYGYSFSRDPASAPSKCIVHAELNDLLADPLDVDSASAYLVFENKFGFHHSDGRYIGPALHKFAVDSLGSVETVNDDDEGLAETASVSMKYEIYFTYTQDSIPRRIEFAPAEIPDNTDTIELFSLTSAKTY